MNLILLLIDSSRLLTEEDRALVRPPHKNPDGDL